MKQDDKKKKKDRTHLIVKEEPLAGMSMINIFRLLWQNKFYVHPKYWLRFWYAIALSWATTPLRVIEILRFQRKIKKTKVEIDPLFIIGHYRTGTTYLMTLLAHDKNMGYVSNLEGYAPHFFLAFHNFTTKLLDMSLPEQRPMDNVIMGSDEPTEEEYSIGAMSKYGFYNGFIFPWKFKLYSRYNSFRTCKEKDVERWKKTYLYFVKKMTYKYKGKRIFLKNPTTTYRIEHILKMYPNAKFIHLYREPYEMYASSVKFFREVFAIYALQTWKDEDLQQGILDNVKEMYEVFNETRSLIPKENIVDIKYEDFIKDPIPFVKSIYKDLKIDGYDKVKDDFVAYFKSQATYKPNVHEMSDDVINRVNNHWDFIREQHGYKRLEPKNKK